jgi:hypothetical protein
MPEQLIKTMWSNEKIYLASVIIFENCNNSVVATTWLQSDDKWNLLELQSTNKVKS